MKRSSEEREKEILELINEGMANYDIYKETGASYKLIDRIRREYGKERVKIKERDPDKARFSLKQIKQWNYLHARYGKKEVSNGQTKETTMLL